MLGLTESLPCSVGGAGGEGAHDEDRKYDDWLPGARRQAQLLQNGGHQPPGQQAGPGLCPG